MKKNLISLLFFVSLLSLLGQASFAQDIKDRIKVGGLMFADYFFNIDNVDGNVKNVNGFQFRRIYLTTDISVAENFDSRFRLETDQSTNSNTASGKLGVMVKDAYLKWKGIFSGSDLVFGISPTPAFDVSEAAWSYRSLEKTIMDLNGIVGSRDFGVDLKGKITDAGSVNYWVKIANNSSNGPETDKHKRYYALVQVKPADGFQATLYYDYASLVDVTDNIDKTSKPNSVYVVALFLNYQQKSDFALGFEGFTRSWANKYRPTLTSVLNDQNTMGLSFWAWVSVTENLRLVGRYDSFDPNSDIDNDKVGLIIAGLDYKVAKNVSIIPNVEITSYQKPVNANGSTSSSNFVGRVTLAFTF